MFLGCMMFADLDLEREVNVHTASAWVDLHTVNGTTYNGHSGASMCFHKV